jgi:hypothetical protein
MMPKEEWPEEVPRQIGVFELNIVSTSLWEAARMRNEMKKMPIKCRTMMKKYFVRRTGQKLFAVYYRVI